MGVGMKHAREEKPMSLALSLTTDSPTTSCTTSADDSSGAPALAARKRTRHGHGRVVATSGEGEFVCKTCSRAFMSFQALGGHRTSHLRGRHALELGVGLAKAIKEKKRSEDKEHGHDCHVCGLGFETGQALGGHMSRHREEMALNGAGARDDHRVWRSVALLAPDEDRSYQPPVLLELFV